MVEPSDETSAASTSVVRAAPSADARAAVHALTRASRILERSLPELSLADFRVLSAVAEGEGRASRLAQRLALGKPAISSTVDSLVRRGLLRREAHDSDQRAVELVLTSTGDDVRRASENALAEVVTALAAGTDDPDGLLASLAALGEEIERRQASFAAERMGATPTAARTTAATPTEAPTTAAPAEPAPVAPHAAPTPEAAR